MTSDIDDLLERMRRDEKTLRETVARDPKYGQETAGIVARMLQDADRLARWIAAVEGLVAFKANHLNMCDCLARAEAACEPETDLQAASRSATEHPFRPRNSNHD